MERVYYDEPGWKELSGWALTKLYYDMQKWCRFYAATYYTCELFTDPSIPKKTDYEFDMMYKRIEWIEENHPDLYEGLNEFAASVTDFNDRAMADLGGRYPYPTPKDVPKDIIFRKKK